MYDIPENFLKKSDSWRRAMLGEALVVLDLTLNGFNAVRSPIEQSAFDLLLDDGHHLKRVQVKTTAAVHETAKGEGKKQKRYDFALKGKYPLGSIDIFAFVALDVGAIRYALPSEINPDAAKKHYGAVEFSERSDGSLNQVISALSLKPYSRSRSM